MASDKRNRKVLTTDEATDAEKLLRLMEWAELIHKDMGDFIGAMDRLYTEMQTKGKPPAMDFLTAVNSNKE